jgi:hypothetical protein
MSSPITQRTVADFHNDSSFKPFQPIQRNDFEIKLNEIFYYGEQKIRGYQFTISVEGIQAGIYTALIEDDFTNISDVGNIGFPSTENFGAWICL